jgi:hypothetical protein
MSGYETPPNKAPGAEAARRERDRLGLGWLAIAGAVVIAVLVVLAVAWAI